MQFNKYSQQVENDQTPNIHQNLLSSTLSVQRNFLGNTSKEQDSPEASFPSPLKFNQKLDCSMYFIAIFTNLCYVVFGETSITGMVISIQKKEYATAELLAIFFVIMCLGLLMICQYACLKAFLLQLLQRAQPKNALLETVKGLQNNDTSVTISLKTTHHEDDENSYQTEDKHVSFQLKSNYCQIQNQELSNLLDRHKLIFVEYQVRYSFINSEDQAKVNTILQKYKEENEMSLADKDTKLDIKSQLKFDTKNLPSYYYSELPNIKIIKWWGYFFTVIGLIIPFIIVARCMLKRHKVKIVKKIFLK